MFIEARTWGQNWDHGIVVNVKFISAIANTPVSDKGFRGKSGPLDGLTEFIADGLCYYSRESAEFIERMVKDHA